MIEFRNAHGSEIDLILDWAAAEGWNPGIDDAKAFEAADPDGFFVATEADALLGAISVVNHSADYAFLGLYIVRPDARGKGIGLRLWHHALAHAGARTVGLDGVPDQQENYAASGFVHAGATTRFSGPVAGRVSADVRPAAAEDLPGLVALEGATSGVEKPAYLGSWLKGAARRKTLVLDSAEGIVGFCTVRQCRDGAKIGPLVATTSDGALSLIAQAATLFDGDLVIDVPGASSELVTLCRDLGLEAGFHTARMYKGPLRPQPQGIFAVTSLELG